MSSYYEKYIKYKTKYLSLKNANGKIHMGGGKWELLSQKEKDDIMKKYNTIINGDKKCMKYPKKYVVEASKGMYIYDNQNESQKILCNSIEMANKSKSEPIVHNDSLTAWCNQAAELYGLEVGDITKMKFGDKIKVIFMDRNVGDYMHGTKKGTKYEPTKQGLTYGTYIHAEGLSGIIYLEDAGVISNFQWEINYKSLGEKYPFWCPLNCNEECGKQHIDINKLNPKIKVGWRGPSVNLSVAEKHLPKYVVHYDDWWNDSAPFRHDDFLKTKGTKK